MRRCVYIASHLPTLGFALVAATLLFSSVTFAQKNAFDLNGAPADPLHSSPGKIIVLVFVRTDCPISNGYAPEFRRLIAEFASQKVHFSLIYPNPDETPDAINKHLKEFNLSLAALRDPEHHITRAAGVKVTPEAAVFVPGTGFVYHGRIDNRYQDLGLARPAATERDLRDVLNSVLSGKSIRHKSAPAIGCYIPNLK